MSAREQKCVKMVICMGEKVVYCDNLYLGSSIDSKKLDKLKKKIVKKPLLCSHYLIAFSNNPSDQLDIMQARGLVFHYYSTYPLRVVGIAADYEEAVALVEQMVKECLESRGDCALKEFLGC